MKKKESREAAPVPQVAKRKFIGSAIPQCSIKKIWQLEAKRKVCEGQIKLWEGRLKAAEQGVARQTAQMTLGNGLSHSILRSYQGDVAEAKRMILAFEDERLKILTEIDSLTPNAAKAAERSEQQNVLAGQILLLEEMTYKLDSALEVVRQILKDRIDLSSKMREGTALLEFDGRIDLDEQRFEHLLQTLPAHMARETERWAMWFLGAEDDRAPYVIHGGEAVLPETLHSANAFRTGDCPSLTARERHDVESIISSEVVHPPGYEELAVRMPGAEAPEVPVGKVQWGLLRP